MGKRKEEEFLQILIKQPLIESFKTVYWELYHFGFCEWIYDVGYKGEKRRVCKLALHVMCDFKIIYRNVVQRTIEYDIDMPPEEFKEVVNPLLGCFVNDIYLNDKNDLILDLGDYKLELVTRQDGEESWLLFTPGRFTPGKKLKYLTASNLSLELDEEFT